jgi:hypothetical protein
MANPTQRKTHLPLQTHPLERPVLRHRPSKALRAINHAQSKSQHWAAMSNHHRWLLVRDTRPSETCTSLKLTQRLAVINRCMHSSLFCVTKWPVSPQRTSHCESETQSCKRLPTRTGGPIPPPLRVALSTRRRPLLQTRRPLHQAPLGSLVKILIRLMKEQKCHQRGCFAVGGNESPSREVHFLPTLLYPLLSSIDHNASCPCTLFLAKSSITSQRGHSNRAMYTHIAQSTITS